MNALTREQLIMLAAGVMIGGGVGYMVADIRLKKKYEQAVKIEVEDFKDVYKRIHKLDEYSDIEGLVAGSGEGIQKGHQEALREQRNVYADTLQGLEYTTSEEVETDGESATVTETEVTKFQGPDGRTIHQVEEVVVHNVFDQPQPNPVELEDRDPTKPYVISYEEFMENGTRDSITVTYFIGDEVLIDEQEDVIDDIDSLIGLASLERFGHGSQDDSIVYVRNERLGADFEVVRDEGSYVVTVLGENPGDRHGERNA